jgi:hypothetical protein
MPRIQRPGSTPVYKPPRPKTNRNNSRSTNNRAPSAGRKRGGGGGNGVPGEVRENLIQDNPQDFYNLITDRAGLGTGTGVQPFNEWVRTNGYDEMQRGYSNALINNQELKFEDYVGNAYGIPTNKAATQPVNTGNAFTSSSAPGTFNSYLKVQSLQKNKLGKKQIANQRKKFQSGAGQLDAGDMLAPSGNPGYQNFANAMRLRFNQLTPELAGTYSPAYGMAPSRWSVFG